MKLIKNDFDESWLNIIIVLPLQLVLADSAGLRALKLARQHLKVQQLAGEEARLSLASQLKELGKRLQRELEPEKKGWVMKMVVVKLPSQNVLGWP
jgi:hypothetical protein